MGELANKAKEKSKFLLMDKGESVVVKYTGFRFIVDPKDPDVEKTQYILELNGRRKYWDNSAGRIMMIFDKIPLGGYAKISRMKAMKADGTEDVTKSKYEVVHCLNDGTPITEGMLTQPTLPELGAGVNTAAPTPPPSVMQETSSIWGSENKAPAASSKLGETVVAEEKAWDDDIQ